MKNILLLEDEKIQAKYLINIIKDYSQKKDRKINIFHAANINEAKEMTNKDIVYDAYFIDICLDKKQDSHGGLDWVNTLPPPPRKLHMCNKPLVCFITGFPNYIWQAVNEIHCYSYILKPYQKREIHSQLDALFENDQNLHLRTTDKIFVSFPIADLAYIHSRGRYQDFYTTSTTYRSRQYTLKELLKMLPDNFCLCHKSYIINQSHVENYDFVNYYAHMKGREEIIPLSRNFLL